MQSRKSVWGRRLADVLPALALLAAALWPSATPEPGVVLFLVDGSASMGREPLSLARAQRWRLEAECARRHPGERASVAVFGQGVELLLGPTDPAAIDFDALERALAQPRPQLAADTRLDARAAALVAHLARNSRLEEVRVLSDGELAAPAELPLSGPPWTWAELEGRPIDDAAVEFEDPPAFVAPGAPFRLGLRYARRGACRERPLAIEVLQEGARVARHPVAATAPARGTISIELQAPSTGTLRLEVRHDLRGDDCAENDRAEREIAIEGVPRVAWVGATEEPSRRAGLALERMPSSALASALGTFDVVWIEEQDAAELPAEALARFVAEGGGLVVSGLERQLESGGYDRSPWRELLPVAPELEDGLEEIAVLIDASGSMDGERFEEALLGLDALRDRWGAGRQVRAACFATEVGTWSELKARGAAEAASAQALFGAVEPRGATHLARALRATLEAGASSRRAVIVLTDGREEDPEIEDPVASARALAALAESLGVRVHALAIGAGADRAWLEALVAAGRLGTVQRVEGVDSIASALLASAASERIVRTSIRAIAGELPAGFPAALSPFAAHRRARLEPGAAAPFATADGFPLVALRAAGAGRVAWVATTLGGGSDDFADGALVEALARWTAGEALGPRWDIGRGARHRVDLRFPRAASLAESQGAVSAVWTAVGAPPRTFELLRAGPRNFQASSRATGGGTLEVRGVARRSWPEALSEELSPFAPRWAFRGRAGSERRMSRDESLAPSSPWIGVALVLLLGAALRWGRRSSRGAD
ncbi:MAG: VWA domain-containing protein [Planctomycetes bacterium]|nr:VWA domain-containing protein [Planctomycetota bacterium]